MPCPNRAAAHFERTRKVRILTARSATAAPAPAMLPRADGKKAIMHGPPPPSLMAQKIFPGGSGHRGVNFKVGRKLVHFPPTSGRQFMSLRPTRACSMALVLGLLAAGVASAGDDGDILK